MEDLPFVEKFILDARQIDIIPHPHLSTDVFTASLGLFFSLKQLPKNVNLIVSEYPEKFRFLSPAINHKLSRTDFQIIIPPNAAEISDVFYEKKEAGLNLYFKTTNGRIDLSPIIIKKPPVSDLVIAVGFEQMGALKNLLQGEPDFILNLDNHANNEQFGQLNLVFESSATLIEGALKIIAQWSKDILTPEAAQALLAGIVEQTNNFKSAKTNANLIAQASMLVQAGADLNNIQQAFYGLNNPTLLPLLGRALSRLVISKNNLAIISLSQSDFIETHSQPADLRYILQRLSSGLFPFDQLLLLWEPTNQPKSIQGVFYSTDDTSIQKIKTAFCSQQKGEGLLLRIDTPSLQEAQNLVLKVIHN